jgi:hypothetical protein
MLDEQGIKSTIVLFGGVLIPESAEGENTCSETLGNLSRYYEEARLFS